LYDGHTDAEWVSSVLLRIELGRAVKAGLCSKGPAGTKETFFIKGSTSTLALTLS